MVSTDPATIATVVLAAAIYSAVYYLPKRAGPDEEPWQLKKVVKTGVATVIVAGFVLYTGTTLTPSSVPEILASLGAVGAVEKIAQLIVRLVRRFRGEYGTPGGN